MPCTFIVIVKTPNRWQLRGEIKCTIITAFCYINFDVHFKWKFESIITHFVHVKPMYCYEQDLIFGRNLYWVNMI